MTKIFCIAALTLTLVGCGPTKKADTTVAVAGTDSACTASETALKAGSIRFDFTNKAKLTNELYVLGSKDRVIKEFENVLPGNTGRIDVSLKAGTYTLSCKPGQTGEGFRQTITVTGSGGATGATTAKADRSLDVAATEYAFSFATPPTITKGEAIEFVLSNNGKERHEFEVLGPDGKAIGEIAGIKGERTGSAVFVFKDAGTFTYRCMLTTRDGRLHRDLGMRGTLDVA